VRIASRSGTTRSCRTRPRSPSAAARAEAAAKLRRTLAARRKPGPSYLLEPHDVGELDPGVYDGVVYLTQPFRELANLRVVVQDPAPGT
jgi:hypothetical protein